MPLEPTQLVLEVLEHQQLLVLVEHQRLEVPEHQLGLELVPELALVKFLLFQEKLGNHQFRNLKRYHMSCMSHMNLLELSSLSKSYKCLLELSSNEP